MKLIRRMDVEFGDGPATLDVWFETVYQFKDGVGRLLITTSATSSWVVVFEAPDGSLTLIDKFLTPEEALEFVDQAPKVN